MRGGSKSNSHAARDLSAGVPTAIAVTWIAVSGCAHFASPDPHAPHAENLRLPHDNDGASVGHYDVAFNNSCREPVADLVADKERANFCEYFKPAVGRTVVAAPPKSEAQKKLEALFKKKS
jgi:hypothetical protein